MSINCKHWSECGIKQGGCCAINLFQGAPSLGICRRCDKREPINPAKDAELIEEPKPKPEKRGLRWLAKGAKGLAKAALGLDPTPPGLLIERQGICNACPEKTEAIGGITTKCKQCGCALPAKQRVNSEQCPIGKWPTVEPTSSPTESPL